MEHGCEHDAAPRQRRVWMGGRRIDVRSPDQANQQRGFGQCEVGRRLPKIPLGGGFHPVEALTEVHFIEIELENAVFRVGAFDLHGRDNLGDFSAERTFSREQAHPRELLGNRAATLCETSRLDIDHRGPRPYV